MKLSFSTVRHCIISLIVSILSLVIAILFFSYGNKTTLMVFPSKDGTVAAITDSSDNGHSVIHMEKSDSLVSYTYQLKPGFTYPYCGMKLFLNRSASAGIDFSKYDSIHIGITISDSNAIRIFLKSYDPEITDTLKPNTYWYHEKEFIPSQYPGVATFSLHDFSISTWWRLEHNVKELQRLDKLRSVNHIEFLNGFSTTHQDSVHVAIDKIYFTGRNRTAQAGVVAITSLLWIFTTISFITVFLRKHTASRKIENTRSNILSTYKKVVTKSDDELKWERITLYVAEHYNNPELNIEIIATQTGTNRKDISSLIQKFLNTNFKGYLNDLRLTESARLLKESDKQITEIAFSVGYNNISHFSRIFKEKYSVSPKEYRDMK